MRAVSIIQEKSVDMIAQYSYYDKSTKMLAAEPAAPTGLVSLVCQQLQCSHAASCSVVIPFPAPAGDPSIAHNTAVA